ncbi:hypothetical protein AAMO2058_000154300 [Amorphochlora amoebiformis]|mmetsp:Transcript_28639/g.45655  ORF Transcript_28639/g.45655 Transcript_28639/m.45655 type:complete len:580 (-) Transcript_28639:72-1811(-)
MPNANNGQVCYQGALDSKTNPVRRTFESLEEKNSHASEPSDTDGHRLCRTASVVEDPETAVKMIGYYPDTSPLLKPLPTSSHPERLRYKSFDGDDIDALDMAGELRGWGRICSLREGSIRASVFNLCSATLGAGALSLPFAFKQSGLIPGILLLYLGGAATFFSIHLLIKARDVTRARSYEDLTVQLLGQRMGVLMEICVIVFCFGCAVAYIIAVGDILEGLLASFDLSYLGAAGKLLESRDGAVLVVFLFVMFPLSLLDSVNDLRFPSFLGVCSIFYLVASACLHTLAHMSKTGTVETLSNVSILKGENSGGALLALPVMIFAYTCQTNVFSVYHALARPSARRMQKVSYRAVGICFTIYFLMGVAGYLNFGPQTRPNILQNYISISPPTTEAAILIPIKLSAPTAFDHLANTLMAFASVAVVVTVLVAFPLVIFPCRFTMGVLVFGYDAPPMDQKESSGEEEKLVNETALKTSEVESANTMPWMVHFWVTLGLCMSALVISLFVPNISVVFALMGSTTSSFVCFILPAVLYLRLVYAGKLERPSGAKMCLVYTLAIGGSILGVASTITTIVSQLVNP